MPQHYFSGELVLRVGPVLRPGDVAELACHLSEINNEVNVRYVRWDGPAAGGLVPEVALAIVVGVPATVLLTELTKDVYAAVKNKLAEFAKRGRVQHGAKTYAPLGIAIESKEYVGAIWFIFSDTTSVEEMTTGLRQIPRLAERATEEGAFQSQRMPFVFTYDPVRKAWRTEGTDKSENPAVSLVDVEEGPKKWP